jgi:hypothetical protein
MNDGGPYYSNGVLNYQSSHYYHEHDDVSGSSESHRRESESEVPSITRTPATAGFTSKNVSYTPLKDKKKKNNTSEPGTILGRKHKLSQQNLESIYHRSPVYKRIKNSSIQETPNNAGCISSANLPRSERGSKF